ncbi:uncharacterized protein LOC124944073 [Impatiens glandulifera]|uniref:uncharacterized protein LOC124944073 n=1 Tax=Impatiens glandulifera TaxID=253017 RepID=UPI001FB0C950|nr:uncharacterized protein LOC124944073 [Impatiens glandulifera]
MASNWSAENAAQAFIKTTKMGKGMKEPDVLEFISAQAAGNNARLMVAACSGGEGISTVVALGAAAHLTGGKVVCILKSTRELIHYQSVLPEYLCDTQVEFAIGEAETLIVNDYKESDFVVVDCNLYDHEKISGLVKAVKERSRINGGGDAIVLGYNAFNKGSWGGSTTQFLPIGEGLLLTRISGGKERRKSGNWVVKVDKCTGEEHVFRVRSRDRTITC